MQVLSPPPPPQAVSEPLIPEIGATRFPTSFTQTDVHREDLTKTDTQKKTTNDIPLFKKETRREKQLKTKTARHTERQKWLQQCIAAELRILARYLLS